MTASTDSTGIPVRTPDDQAPRVRLVLGAVLVIFLAQMTLNPIIAPLAREVGLAEWQIGATISAAAIMMVLTSQLWGRRSQSWGRKPVLVAAFALATVCLALFGVVAWFGTIGLLSGWALFALFVLLRGVGFGTAIAAVPTTAQAYIADVTADERARVKGMAGIGAVQAVAMIVGSVLGGALALFGLLTPLMVVPLLLAAALVLLVVRLRREPQQQLIATPTKVRARDGRVWPFLVAGFGMFTALGFVQIITGFLIQDRLALGASATAAVTGGALLAAGMGMIAAQAVVVPRSGWAPPMLLRVGTAVALGGFALLAFDLGAVAIFVALLCIGLGLGIAMPGYTAGPTLLVAREEQGGLAGLISATNGLTFVVAPTAGTALYSLWPPLPVITGAVIMAAVLVFVLVHPRLRLAR